VNFDRRRAPVILERFNVAFRIIIISLIVIVVVAFMGTQTVRFNEQAIRTTFGRADASDVITTPGLHLRVPLVHSITTYDTRLRYLQSDAETQQTLDKSQLLVTSFVTWRVSDPLKFFKIFNSQGSSAREHYKAAESILKVKLRSAASEVSSYSTSDLFATADKQTKLDDLEKAMLAKLKATGTGNDADASLTEYGIEPVRVGIVGLGVPQDTSAKIFDRMKAARDKIANEVRNIGKGEATKIRGDAESSAGKINAFANQLAGKIRSRGEIEASEFLKQMNTDPQLAVFVNNMDFISKAFGRQTTLVIPTSMPGFEFFRMDSVQKMKTAGMIPGPTLDKINATTTDVKASGVTTPEPQPVDPKTGEEPARVAR
jgi:membrane protease subunit HflC